MKANEIVAELWPVNVDRMDASNARQICAKAVNDALEWAAQQCELAIANEIDKQAATFRIRSGKSQ